MQQLRSLHRPLRWLAVPPHHHRWEGWSRTPRDSSLWGDGRSLQLAGALILAILAADALQGLGAAVGAAVCGVACTWAATRSEDERPVWATLAVACAGLAVGSAVAAIARTPAMLGPYLGLEEYGFFSFATAAAVAHLAWPEIRRSTGRVVATLVDTVTLVAAAALWVSSGFPPLGSLPGPLLVSVAHVGVLAIPTITAVLVLPQLTAAHQRTGRALVASMALILVAAALGARELAGCSTCAALSWPVRCAAFALLAATALQARPGPFATSEVGDDFAQPPLRLVGAIGVAALLAGLVGSGSPQPGLIVVLAMSLVAREMLHGRERQRAQEQLAASLDLEAQLLAHQAQTGLEIAPGVALRESCRLAVDVLHADAALAWIGESDVLVLTAAAPERREVLVGRRLLMNDADSLAARVFRVGAPELCDVRAPGSRVDRLLATLLDAGSLLGIPIMREGAPIGALVLVRERGHPAFSHFDLQRALLIVAQAQSTLRQLELYEELERQLTETTLIHRFAVQAVAARTHHDVAWYLMESIRSRVALERAAVFLTDDGSRLSLTPVAHFHARGTRAQGTPRAADAPLAQLRVPLQYGENIIGYADLFRSAAEPFTSSETMVAQRLAQQAALAMQNVRLQEVSGKVSTYRELDRLKTELLNTVSHDLRGPLTNIKGYASTLVDSAEDMDAEERREFLVTIEEEADRLRDLLEHLLDLSKIEAGVLHLDLQPVHLSRIVSQTVSAIRGADHDLALDIPEDVFVMADSRRFRQVLQNLLENAVKYSPQGGRVRIAAEVADGEVFISVVDQGVGIPRHQWDRVFRPYQRADTAKAHGIAGTGLGLAICKGIVEAHGGRIWVESEPGVGSTFSFSVPRAFNAYTEELFAVREDRA